MLKEILFFIQNGPAVGRRRKNMGMVEFMQDLYSRMDTEGFAELRSKLVGDLAGDILEVGSGTGATFKYYSDKARVTAIEPHDEFLPAAEKASKDSVAEIRVISGKGEELPFEDDSFDVVCASLVLCSVESPRRTLQEFKRVVRPNGEIRLLEHVRSEHWAAGPLMDLLNPLWHRINNVGCNLNRKTVDTVREAGFTIHSVESYQLFSKSAPAAFPYRIIRAGPSSKSNSLDM